MKKIIIISICFAILVLLYFLPFHSGLLLTDGDGKQIHFFPWDTDNVTIGWRHSVELTPWEETYHIDKDGEWSLTSTVYQSYGAGTPDIEGDVEFLSDGLIRVTGIKRTIPNFSLYYVPFSKYYIKGDSNKYFLSDYLSESTSVKISYEQLNFYAWMRLKFSQYLSRRVES